MLNNVFSLEIVFFFAVLFFLVCILFNKNILDCLYLLMMVVYYLRIKFHKKLKNN